MPLPRVHQQELLDTDVAVVRPRTLDGNLRDIRLANRFFGGTRAVLGTIMPIIVTWPSHDEPISILDVATGSADIPLAVVHRSRHMAKPVHIVATDVQPEIVAVARRLTAASDIIVEQADMRALPYVDAAFDIVTMSLALHHLDTEHAVQALAEMRRVGRRMLVVNDLERSRAGLVGAWLFSRAMTRNRLTRNDAPLSVRRAYTCGEALALARSAGWNNPVVRALVPFRFVLTGTP
jgi:2-polyprenyl-3-methyl-5-hydroxy-6-metoxy-1,4-benzoquinol methylase